MSVRYVTHLNGFTEIIGERTPSEEAEWFSRHNKVSKFPSANYRSFRGHPATYYDVIG